MYSGVQHSFRKLRMRLGFTLRKHTFHSFRSTVLRELLNAEVFPDHAKLLAGHKINDLTYGGYPGANPLTPEVAAAAIAKLRYPFPTSGARS